MPMRSPTFCANSELRHTLDRGWTNMEAPLECPQCGTRDMPHRVSSFVFLCSYCAALFSAFPITVSGEDFIRISVYQKVYSADEKKIERHPMYGEL